MLYRWQNFSNHSLGALRSANCKFCSAFSATYFLSVPSKINQTLDNAHDKIFYSLKFLFYVFITTLLIKLFSLFLLLISNFLVDFLVLNPVFPLSEISILSSSDKRLVPTYLFLYWIIQKNRNYYLLVLMWW